MSRAVWVTRDGERSTLQGYNLYETKPDKLGYGYLVWPHGEDYFCPKLFERITGFRLKLGEGPVKVKIEVKQVK